MIQAYGLYGHIQANRIRSVILLAGFVVLLHVLLFSILLIWSAFPAPTIILKSAVASGFNRPIFNSFAAASKDLIVQAGAAQSPAIVFAKDKYVLAWQQNVFGQRVYMKGLDPVTCASCGREDRVSTIEWQLADVVEHVRDPAVALAQAARLLRPGGACYVSTINRTAKARWLAVHVAEGVGLIPRGTHDAELFVSPAELEHGARGFDDSADPAIAEPNRQRGDVHVDGLAIDLGRRLNAGETGMESAPVSAAQLAAMNSDDLNAFTTDQFSRMSTAQVAALTASQVGHMEQADLNALGSSQWGAMSSTQVAGLTTDQLAGMETADLRSITTAAIGGLTSDQVKGLTSDEVGSLTTAQVAALKVSQLGGLTAADMVAMTSAQIGVLSTAQAQALSTDQLSAIEAADLKALSTAAIRALSNAQIDALTASRF